MSSSLFPHFPTDRVHFIAVCGVAMAGAAIELKKAGLRVTGSDNQFYPPMSDLLSSHQVEVFRGFNPENLPAEGLIVVGNAVSRGNPELEAALDRRLTLISLPQLISWRYLTNRLPLVVTGTHGKTTTTALAAYVFSQLGLKPGWMIGGQPLDLDLPCQNGEGDVFIIEGDEYDSAWFDKRPKFLQYHPFYAILTGVEFDHSDIYASLDEVEKAFTRFIRLLPRKGRLIVCADDAGALRLAQGSLAPIVTYGKQSPADWRLTPSTITPEGWTQAEIINPQGLAYILTLQLPGEHNLLNALAVVAAARELGLDTDAVVSIIRQFQGVARRLQCLVDNGRVHLYDDFAHHPTAIKATLEALRLKHPDRRLITVLEPRSNTMVRSYFQNELEEALIRTEVVILAPLYRSEKIPEASRLDLNHLVQSLRRRGKMAFKSDDFEQVVEHLQTLVKVGDVVVMMSNGGFGGIKDRVLEIVKTK